MLYINVELSAVPQRCSEKRALQDAVTTNTSSVFPEAGGATYGCQFIARGVFSHQPSRIPYAMPVQRRQVPRHQQQSRRVQPSWPSPGQASGWTAKQRRPRPRSPSDWGRTRCVTCPSGSHAESVASASCTAQAKIRACIRLGTRIPLSDEEHAGRGQQCAPIMFCCSVGARVSVHAAKSRCMRSERL